jgi:hypothetical protein
MHPPQMLIRVIPNFKLMYGRFFWAAEIDVYRGEGAFQV